MRLGMRNEIPDHLLKDVTLTCADVARLCGVHFTTVAKYRNLLGVKRKGMPRARRYRGTASDFTEDLAVADNEAEYVISAYTPMEESP